MPLAISNGTITGELTIDEEYGTGGVSADGTDDDVASPSADFSTFLGTLAANLPNPALDQFPQYASDSITGFVATATDLKLTMNADGDAYPANGIDSGLTTVDGEAIYLFEGASGDAVIGRIGDATGDIAFVIYLDETKDGNGTVTAASLNTAMYLPIEHATADAVDIDDVKDLTNLVYLTTAFPTASTDTFANLEDVTPGNNTWALVAPDGFVENPANPVDIAPRALLVTGNAGQTVNVSTQGYGVANQTINPNTASTGLNELLRVDFVTDADVDYTQSEANLAGNIAYGTHQEDIFEAGFTISQAPDPVDVQIAAFDVSNNAKGSTFLSEANAGSNQELQKIVFLEIKSGNTVVERWELVNGTMTNTVGDSNSIAVTGMNTTSPVTMTNLLAHYSIRFKTEGNMDRFTIDNVDQTKNDSMDVNNIFYVKTTSVTQTSSTEIGSHIEVQDDGPTATLTAVENASIVLDETVGAKSGDATADDENASADTTDIGYAKVAASLLFTSDSVFGADGAAANNDTAFGLVVNPDASGLVDTQSGDAVLLSLDNDIVYGKTGAGDVVFTISIDPATGEVTVAQFRAIEHNDPDDHDQSTSPASMASGLVLVQVTVEDRDGDTDSDTTELGSLIKFEDDGPTILDVDSLPLVLNNTQDPPSGTTTFAYSLGSDLRTYDGTSSDFSDIDLSGTVGQSSIENPTVTLSSEDASEAVFDISFQYKADPNASALSTASGTLSFDKDAGTYTVELDAPIGGFEVLQTSHTISREPTSNVGHPEIVVSKLADDFFVQFTAEASPMVSVGKPGGTKQFADGELISGPATWVSATQSTNGVAGDTIQKGEALTLRFFDTSPGIQNENTNPNATADGVFLKFDGIGNSEDLIVILNLIDDKGTVSTADDGSTTKAIIIDNSDIFRKSTGGVPTEFASFVTLDNNDGFVVIEKNDYNFSGEHWEIQGLQILQSANGLTGTGIDLNRTTGATGGSETNGTELFSSGHTNDVLKITDIGFIKTEAGTQDAELTFQFNIIDGDGDETDLQTLNVQVHNDVV